MRVLLLIVLASCAAQTSEVRQELSAPPSQPSPYQGLVQASLVDVCTVASEQACPSSCGAACWQSTYVTCCHGKPCEDYGTAYMYSPSSAFDGGWARCLASTSSCGVISPACQMVTPLWPVCQQFGGTEVC